MFGVRLLLTHPELAFRSCDDCRKYLYDADGSITRRPARVGLPVLRGKAPTPCATPTRDTDRCPKIPDDAEGVSAAYAIELSDRHRQTLEHYLECRAVGQFPDDWIVRRNARIIRGQYDAHDQRSTFTMFSLMLRESHAKPK